MSKAFEVVIVGGGAAGITIAAILNRRNRQIRVAIVEPSDVHYYQPALTLVGAGVQSLSHNTRLEVQVIPKNATWIKDKVVSFEPEDNQLQLAGGDSVQYDYLVVCAGLQCDWDKIEGLVDNLGKNGVTSNYSPEHAPYTWECIRDLRADDGPAVFTQSAMPIKCPGAPQKIAYLAAHYFQKKRRRDIPVIFRTATPSIFGVPYFAKVLMKVIKGWGIDFTPQTSLIKIDGKKRMATFVDGEGQTSEVEYGMLHVVPPQSAPDFIQSSPLADENGWMDVDKNTLQSTRYDNVFGLGDVTNSPNSKTAAAIRKQAPVVIDNLLALKANADLSSDYDGYSSCPLTTSYGKMVLAEFRYGGQVTPTFPLSPKVPRRSYWYLKLWGLSILYWDFMLKGYEWDKAHDVDFVED